ncbi:MAG: chaperone modulator CbpM [Chitinophagaceae bacterium]
MKTDNMIPATEICVSHNIELEFIYSLNSHGLINFVSEGEEIFVPVSELPQLEKVIRLNIEMGINFEGIETITHLLQQLEDLHQRIAVLNNKLSFYEGG